MRGLASVSAAVAAWLALGAAALTSGATVASRVGVVPPWWLLGALVAAFLVFGFRVSRARAVPLFGALACVLPWVPGDVPAPFLAWQGAMAGLVWTGVVVAIVAAKPLPPLPALRRVLKDPSGAPWVAALCAVALFVAFWRGPARWLPTGDEPHYLMITQSLLLDGDLRIENNHRRGDYNSYYHGELKPDYIQRGVDRQIYSIHAPGISALVSPAFAVAGYTGAVLFLVLACALGTALAWRLAWEVTGAADAAWVGWASVVGSAPLAAHAYTIYPDGVSGVLVLVGLFAFVRARGARVWPLVAGGVALAVLPWLHTRNAIIAAALGLAIVLRVGAAPRRLGAFLAVPAASAVAWLAFFRFVYGTFDPSAPYGRSSVSSLQNILRGLPGLVFDQQFGALTAAPILLAAVIGTLKLLGGRPDDPVAGFTSSSAPRGEMASTHGQCSRRALGIALVGTVVPYLLVAAAYPMWWGGLSAPARFLVPVLWMAPVGVAVAWASARSPAARAGWLGLLVLSAVRLIMMTFGSDGRLTFTGRAAYGSVLEWATRAVDLSSALPSLHRDVTALAVALALVWLLAWAAWSLAMRVVATTRARASALAVPLAVVAISAAFALAWAVSGVAPLRLDASRHAALGSVWDDGVGIVFARGDVDGRPVPPGVRGLDDTLPQLEMRTTDRRSLSGGQLAALAAIPAGVYRVRVATAEPRTGQLRLEVGRGGVLREVDVSELPVGPDGRPYFDESLPIDVDSLTVLGSKGTSVSSCTVSPLRLVSRRDKPFPDEALVARRYGDVEVFFIGDAQYPERDGMWVKAGSDVPLVVQAPSSIPSLRVKVRNGPEPNRVSVSSGSWRRSLELGPSQEIEIDWPWHDSLDGPGHQGDDRRPLVASSSRVFVVNASAAFRPIDYDPTSKDPRRLGAWVEFR